MITSRICFSCTHLRHEAHLKATTECNKHTHKCLAFPAGRQYTLTDKKLRRRDPEFTPDLSSIHFVAFNS